MSKRTLISILSTALCIYLIIPSTFVHAISNSTTYKTEVKVKLLPTNSFSLKITGKYEVINLDNNTIIPNTNTISISQKDGKLVVINGNSTLVTSKGLNINEIQTNETNEIEVSNIHSASGVMPVKYRGSLQIRTGTSSPALFNVLDMEGYLKGVVPSEMPPSWHIEALKAQAVAARSYAHTQIQRNKSKGYLEMTVSNQVYGGKSNEHANSNRAVDETSGIYATYNNVPIDAVFHSSSGGHTENSENVWTSAVPYLKAVPDPYDQNNGNNHYRWTTTANIDTVKAKLNLKTNQTLVSLRIIERGPSAAVQQMEAIVFDELTKGTSNIPILPKYGSTPDSLRSIFGISLKSIKFDVSADSSQTIKMADGSEVNADSLKGQKIKNAAGTDVSITELNLPVRLKTSSKLVPTSPKSFSFTGDGWGHLLGMSQWGARGMAEQGYKYDQIIKHYYTGVDVKKIN